MYQILTPDYIPYIIRVNIIIKYDKSKLEYGKET